MTEAEWLECTDPIVMFDVLTTKGAFGSDPDKAFLDDRKLFLFQTALERRYNVFNDNRLTQSLIDAKCDAMDNWLEGKGPKEDIFYRRYPGRKLPDDWNLEDAATGVCVWLDDGYPNQPAEHKPLCVELFRDLAGNPYRPAVLKPHWSADIWLWRNVIRMAQSAYDNRIMRPCRSCDGFGYIRDDWFAGDEGRQTCNHCSGSGKFATGLLDNEILAVLSDALESAGCNDADILEHLRNNKRHIRGCYVIDLILNSQPKETE